MRKKGKKKIKNSKINLEKRIEELEHKFDCQGQYSSQNCILIHGISESPNENSDTNHRQQS